MTVHERGYRGYRGGFGRNTAALTIAGDGLRIALGRTSFKRIGLLYLIWFSMCTFFLYVVLGTDIGRFLEMFERTLEGADPTPASLGVAVLDQVLRAFYLGVSFLTAMLAIFVGAGLIAEDLATGALPLYLVRPLRPRDYVLGKALVLPGILLVAIVLPGLLFYVVVGLWQPPGRSWSFLASNLDVLGTIWLHYLIAATSYTGLMLLLSSRATRHAAVAVLAGVAIFAGVSLGMLARLDVVGSKVGSFLLVLDLPHNALTPFLWRMRAYEKEVHWDRLAANGTVVAVSLAILAVGVFSAWRRTRSVEVVS